MDLLTSDPKIKIGILLSLNLLCLFAPFNFNWPALLIAVALGVVTGLFGITLSFHRNLSHNSFKLPKWLEYFFAYCGVHAIQGNPIEWVNIHRYHHRFTDSEKDPHNRIKGFWFSHVSWLFDTNSMVKKCGEPTNVGELEKQYFYRFVRNTYIYHILAMGALLYAVGGFPFIVWGMGVRTVVVYQITWFVNSVCHAWGSQPWNTRDLSKNNWYFNFMIYAFLWFSN
ncbi:hypothetical protein RYX36_011881 [Vicia faba]